MLLGISCDTRTFTFTSLPGPLCSMWPALKVAEYTYKSKKSNRSIICRVATLKMIVPSLFLEVLVLIVGHYES